MFRTLFQLLPRTRRHPAHHHPPRLSAARRRPTCRLAVETLEDRLVLSPMGCHGGNVQFDLQGNTLTITASAPRVAIQCDSFDLAANETVNINLPDSTSAILTRVGVDGSQPPSQILGQITSNGQVFLYNSAGMQFGTASSVNVGSFFATTLGIAAADFLHSDSGYYVFAQEPDRSLARGAIVNYGDVEAQPGGYIVLAGSAVVNGDLDHRAILDAPYGSIYLTVGDQVTADIPDNYTLYNVTVDQNLTGAVAGRNLAIENAGAIVADVGFIHLEAELTSGLYQHAINSEGFISTAGYGYDNGEIDIVAHSDAGDADVHLGGTFNAGPDGISYIDVDGYF